MNIHDSVIDLIGNTPMVELKAFCSAQGITSARVVAKMESYNPAGSAKDRVGAAMLRAAQAEGLLQPGGTIVEPTSGNTGIGLALAAIAMGCRVILTMPDTMSIERRRLLSAYGAELVLTDGALGMSGAIAKAEELAAQIEGAFIPGQFVNPANPEAHYAATGPEIWRDTDGEVDILVAGVGTGGTLSGTGNYLKDQKLSVEVIAVEPADSPVLSGGEAGKHGLQGIGAGFIPATTDLSVIDKITCVTTEQAVETCRALAAAEGILTGFSGGAAVWAAAQAAKDPENEGKMIVVIIPDSGERYLSAGIYD
ncbi:MAG: cysteine synthase A [Ruminococcaceae bacterium]|nr:cysteine synthase A [Oscillospiraceae bacterium]